MLSSNDDLQNWAVFPLKQNKGTTGKQWDSNSDFNPVLQIFLYYTLNAFVSWLSLKWSMKLLMGSRFCVFDVDLPLIIILSISIITLSINSWVQQYANLTISDI